MYTNLFLKLLPNFTFCAQCVSSIYFDLYNLCSVIETTRERLLREFPKWIMNEEEYQNQTLEIDEVCDLTAMLLTTAQVSTWFVEFLIHLPKHQNSQVTYLDRIQGRNGTCKIEKIEM